METKKLVIGILTLLGAIAVGYLIMVGAVWILFRLVETMTHGTIDWNVWIAGLISYIIWLIVKN